MEILCRSHNILKKFHEINFFTIAMNELYRKLISQNTFKVSVFPHCKRFCSQNFVTQCAASLLFSFLCYLYFDENFCKVLPIGDGTCWATISVKPLKSPKNRWKTNLNRGRTFIFDSSFVNLMPSSSQSIGSEISTSPTIWANILYMGSKMNSMKLL